ncbi:MAG: Trp family transcriptional regulator [Patescibacteria group bacterium]
MGKVDYTTVPTPERQTMIRELAKFLLSVKDEKDMIQVLYRLLTHSEVVMLGRRLQIAEELLQGSPYHTIREKLKVGITTIKSIDNWLEYAVRDYDMYRSKKHHEETTREARERSRQRLEPGMPGSFTHLRRSHPGHFLLLNLLLDLPSKNPKPSKAKS